MARFVLNACHETSIGPTGERVRKDIAIPMKLVLAQLVSAYESDPGGRETVEALAKAFDLEPEIVAATLQTHSGIYRMRQEELRGDGFVNNNPHGEHPADDVSVAVKNEMLEIINEIARNVDVPPGVRLKAAIRQVDEHKKRLDKLGLDVSPMRRDEFPSFVRSEVKAWEDIVKATATQR